MTFFHKHPDNLPNLCRDENDDTWIFISFGPTRPMKCTGCGEFNCRVFIKADEPDPQLAENPKCENCVSDSIKGKVSV